MADCFISYASSDLKLADWIAQDLTRRELSVFMAKLSLKPGSHWNAEIQNALRASPWVIFLASRQACSSPYVQQEVGGAVFGGKQLVPIVWDMTPSELPGWASQYQALNLRGMSPQQIAEQIAAIAQRIHVGKRDGLLIATAVIGGLLLFGNGE